MSKGTGRDEQSCESSSGRRRAANPAIKRGAQALIDQSENRPQRLLGAAGELCREMETQGVRVRDLVLAQPPIELLGYLIAQLHMGFFETSTEAKVDARAKQKELIKTYQFALEYVHAVWACHEELADETTPLDEDKAQRLLEALEELDGTTTMYSMVSSAANVDPEVGRVSSDTEFQAKTTWALIRGHRYQVLEEEFFGFVLKPHSEVIESVYGMTSDTVATEIQAISNSFREGFSRAAEVIEAGIQETAGLEKAEDVQAAMKQSRVGGDTLESQVSGAIQDLFYRGTCNLSRHTKLTVPILEDLSYRPGGNAEFFASGEFKGTPMRTLPARIRPGLRSETITTLQTDISCVTLLIARSSADS